MFFNTHPALQLWDLAVVVTIRQRHVTQWLQRGTNCCIPDFCWKCSGSGKENLTFPLLCALFSAAIGWVWRCVCYQVLSMQHFGKNSNALFWGHWTRHRTKRRQSSISTVVCPEKFEDQGITAWQSSSAPPVKNQDKPLSLNYIHNWMRWQETSGADEESWSLIKWSNFTPLGMSCESQHGNTAGSKVCV